jgi:hypothetical protein
MPLAGQGAALLNQSRAKIWGDRPEDVALDIFGGNRAVDDRSRLIVAGTAAGWLAQEVGGRSLQGLRECLNCSECRIRSCDLDQTYRCLVGADRPSEFGLGELQLLPEGADVRSQRFGRE